MNTSTIKNTALSALLLLANPTAHADDWTGNVSGYLGQKSLDDKGWGKQDQHSSLGVLFDFKQQSWPLSIAADIIVSADVDEIGSQKDVAGAIETHLGVRKIFELSNSKISPYLDGGLAIIGVGLENTSAGVTTTQDDTGTGTWIGTGMYIAMTPHFNLGVDVRYSEAEVSFSGVDREAGGIHAGFTAGYHW